MTAAVREALDELIGRARASGRGRARRRSSRSTLVGNPIMHHLLLGIDPTPLGGAPFALAIGRGGADRRRRARAAGQPGRARLRPALHRRPRRRRHRRRDPRRGAAPRRRGRRCSSTSARTPRSCSATATGCSPRRARPARRSRARRSAAASAPRPARSSGCGSTRETLEPRFRVIGCDAWSDEPGFAERPPDRVTGICGSGIIEVVAELFLAGVITADGTIDGSLAARTPRIVPDGRTFSYVLARRAGAGRLGSRSPRTTSGPIQLAKAALYAGIRLLMERSASRRVDRDPARRRVRQPHRPGPRDGPRAHPRLRPRPA